MAAYWNDRILPLSARPVEQLISAATMLTSVGNLFLLAEKENLSNFSNFGIVNRNDVCLPLFFG
jgi:hypothetical protein